MTTTHNYRPLHFGVTRGVLTAGEGGVQYLRAEQPLEPNAECMTDRLVH
jgi:feruloyl-CoA synthase